MFATLFLVEFFHLAKANTSLTSSGLLMSQVLLSAVSLFIAVSIVEFAFPSFFSCHAWFVIGFVESGRF
jgi:hypothetical protein